jgi:hypothetical protein
MYYIRVYARTETCSAPQPWFEVKLGFAGVIRVWHYVLPHSACSENNSTPGEHSVGSLKPAADLPVSSFVFPAGHVQKWVSLHITSISKCS